MMQYSNTIEIRKSNDDDIFDPNSLVRQKKGAQGEEEEEARGQRKAGSAGTPMLSADTPTGDRSNSVKQVLLFLTKKKAIY